MSRSDDSAEVQRLDEAVAKALSRTPEDVAFARRMERIARAFNAYASTGVMHADSLRDTQSKETPDLLGFVVILKGFGTSESLRLAADGAEIFESFDMAQSDAERQQSVARAHEFYSRAMAFVEANRGLI